MPKQHVLVVDDEQSVCDFVRTVLELEQIEVSEAHHVIEAERIIVEEIPDAILLDVGLPGIDGLFYCKRLRANPRTNSVPIIVISGSAEAGAQAEAAGATAYLRKPLDPLELLGLIQSSTGAVPLQRLAGDNATAPAAQLQRLAQIGRRQHEAQNDAHRQMLVGLSSALELRDVGSSGHSERVNAYAVRLALEVEPQLTDDPSLEWGFLLHDVGMLAISDTILQKNGELTREERLEMQLHPVKGEEMLGALALLQGEGLRVVRSHHERWDGTGYPDGLAGLDIPAGARVFAVADALDAMTDGRPYRKAISWDAAVAELQRYSGTQFDPDIVDGLIACELDLRQIRVLGASVPAVTCA